MAAHGASTLQSEREREKWSRRTGGSPGTIWRCRRGTTRSESSESTAARLREGELVGVNRRLSSLLGFVEEEDGIKPYLQDFMAEA
jgi:hypothetical protein